MTSNDQVVREAPEFFSEYPRPTPRWTAVHRIAGGIVIAVYVGSCASMAIAVPLGIIYHFNDDAKFNYFHAFLAIVSALMFLGYIAGALPKQPKPRSLFLSRAAGLILGYLAFGVFADLGDFLGLAIGLLCAVSAWWAATLTRTRSTPTPQYPNTPTP